MVGASVVICSVGGMVGVGCVVVRLALVMAMVSLAGVLVHRVGVKLVIMNCGAAWRVGEVLVSLVSLVSFSLAGSLVIKFSGAYSYRFNM